MAQLPPRITLDLIAALPVVSMLPAARSPSYAGLGAAARAIIEDSMVW